MATKVLSIEIGQGLTRVVEMDYKTKSPKIYGCFTFETPQNVVDDGVVTRNEVFASLLKSECEKRNITTKKAVFSVTSSRIARRDVKIPMVKEKQIQEVINASATDFFPIDTTQYHLVYNIIEKINTKEEKQYRLNLLAVPNEITNSYIAFAESCGLVLEALDYVGNGVFQVTQDAYKEGINVVIKVDENSGLITVIKDGKVDLQRTIVYGVDEAIKIVRESDVYGENLTYAEAIEVLCGKTAIRRKQDEDAAKKTKKDAEKLDESEALAAVKEETTAALNSLISVIGRVIEYYVSSNEDTEIQEIALVGLGADFSGLSKLMTNTLGHKVRVFQNVQSASISKTVEDNSLSVSRYAACIGAAMAPLNLLQETKKEGGLKLGGGADEGVGTSLKGGYITLVLCAAVAIALAGFAVGRDLVEKGKQKELNKQIEMLQPAQEVYDQYTFTKANYDTFIANYAMTATPNTELYNFISELEDKMPTNLNMISFTADATSVTMTLTVDSKVEAAEVLVQLRTFESLATVDSSGITEGTGADGSKVVTMTVNCTYASPAQLN